MRKILHLFLIIFAGSFVPAQSLKPVAKEVTDVQARNFGFEKYNLFSIEPSVQKQAKFQAAAADIKVLKLDQSQLEKIVTKKPYAIELVYPFENREITVELVKVDIFSNDFNVYTDKGKVTDYTPGVYYRGIIKDDTSSLVAISFFKDDVVGITSLKDGGNIILGKSVDSEDFLVYDDRKLRASNTFVCKTDELLQNERQKISYDPKSSKSSLTTTNCVRLYYEVAYKPYQQNGSNVTTTTNWITAIHNNINTLYVNDGVKMSLKTIYIWTTQDPYTGDYNSNLEAFSANRPTFDGDLAHLINYPATTSVAYLNSLCTTYKHAYSGIDKSYSSVPTYSWTVEAMTHEMGHSLGSPHTHACAWNGNNTAIDGCAPTYDPSLAEGTCPIGPIPSGGGTIMSYCHLLSTGINFTKGFGDQPAALIRAMVDSKACLGTDCVTVCPITVSSVTFNSITKTGFTANISDNVSTSWKYRVTKMDGTIITSGTTSSKSLVINGLSSNTYYRLLIGTSCALENAFQTNDIFLTNDDWCGKTFTDSGGLTGNYSDAENFVKTFYPDSAGQKLKLTFVSFNVEEGYDFMTIKNGPSISSPNFSGGSNLTGVLNPGPFESTDSTGAITVIFTSDSGYNTPGWEAKFSCSALAVSDINKINSTVITPNPAKNIFSIDGKQKIQSVKLYDVSGKFLQEFDSSAISKNVLDISKLKAGNYIVTIKTDAESVSRKLIKE